MYLHVLSAIVELIDLVPRQKLALLGCFAAKTGMFGTFSVSKIILSTFFEVKFERSSRLKPLTQRL